MKEYLEALAAVSVGFYLLGELTGAKGAGRTARFVMGTVYVAAVLFLPVRLLGGAR